MTKNVITTDGTLVADAKAAREEAETTEAEASPSRWREADCYAELRRRGWTQQRIADACGTNQPLISVMIRMVMGYPIPEARPSFWTAYQEVTGKKMTAERLVASDQNEWFTPTEYVEAARKVIGEIDLDPASSEMANETVQAKAFYAAKDDGLSQPWYGRIFLNPPYGRLAGEFINRLETEYAAGEVKSAIALVNAHCTDTEWFQALWDHTLCFTDHRIDFDSAGRDKTSTSTHGSVFVYLGDDRERFAKVFAQFGAIVRRYR